ncbi:MAG: glycosyltransferase family 4 protein [Chloroflexi bacterium]|nr:glycosyltransferase family 4 protein [Chloroflexota bacterium]
MRYKLGILTTHPIQYQTPFFRKLAEHPELDVTVYFCSRYGAEEYKDEGFGRRLQWDLPLLEGYRHIFLRNWSPFNSIFTAPHGLVNPGVVKGMLGSSFDAFMIVGWSYATHWMAYLYLRLRGVPILLFSESSALERGRQSGILKGTRDIALKQLFKRISAFLAVGTLNRQFYLQHGVPAHKIFPVPYATNNDFWLGEAQRLRGQKAALRAELGIPDESVVVLFSGKLIPRKRPMDLLQAFASLGKGQAKALVLAGDGELRPLLERYVREKSIESVYFAGFVNQSGLSRFYAMADLLVLPSSFEQWGLVLNEAMCFGLPVIASDRVSAACDLIAHGENGYVFPAGDTTTLSQHLSDLMVDAEKRELMGRRSYECILKQNYEAGVEAVVAALHSVVKRQQGMKTSEELHT